MFVNDILVPPQMWHVQDNKITEYTHFIEQVCNTSGLYISEECRFRRAPEQAEASPSAAHAMQRPIPRVDLIEDRPHK